MDVKKFYGYKLEVFTIQPRRTYYRSGGRTAGGLMKYGPLVRAFVSPSLRLVRAYELLPESEGAMITL